ncbi:MAG TPA: cell division protein FtsZ, partial [Paracoccaceae bacterium]|nr:cell division protein FtsZ [Paracoccaceae bacterium]
TLIVIPNQNLFRIANERTTFADAFKMADQVLHMGVRGVTDLMVMPGLINLDFADIRSVMSEMGKAMMGTGEAEGETRAIDAAEKAIANPLLDEVSLKGAKGVLINITGGYDLTLFELDEAANIIREKVDPEANIIVGSTLDTTMEGRIRVSVVATGIDASAANRAETPQRRPMAQPLPASFTPPAPVAEPPRREPVLTMTVPAAAAAPVAPEPDLFHAAETPAPTFAAAPEAEAEEDLSDLPPPVYRPQPQVAARAAAPAAAPVARAQTTADEGAAGFVAPRPRPAGTPSPQALARLQAAVSKAPTARMAQPAAPVPAAAAPRAADKPRFGIGSLINRMAGHMAEPEAERPAPRTQPPVTAYDDEPDTNPEQERIEIPAFLRRQAN